MLTNILNEARNKLREARARSGAHYDQALKAEKNHKTLGIIVVIFSTLVGTTVFGTLTKETPQTNETFIWLKVATGIVSIAAAVLAALQTFLRFSEDSEKHRKAALAYDTACDKIDYYLLLYSPDESSDDNSIRINALGGWTEITSYLQKAADIAPTLPISLYVKHERKLAEYIVPPINATTSNLITYYDGRKAKPGDINAENGQVYDKVEKRDSGPFSNGTFKLDGQVMSIFRMDNNGRYKLTLTSYNYNGVTLNSLPLNPASRKTRSFIISVEVQSLSGAQHTLIFGLKNARTHDWYSSYRLDVNSNSWDPKTFKLTVPSDSELALRIDDIEVRKVPSTIQLRNLMVSETT